MPEIRAEYADMKMNIEEYNSLVESIFTRFPSVQNASFGDAYKPGLQHIADLNDALGNPIARYRTVHVAGTNGKGSVANMLASALAGAGLKVGLYTSPHILDFSERMRVVDGRKSENVRAGACNELTASLVPQEYVYAFLSRWNARFDEMQLSFFEITTGLAFKWFADENVDVAVIEVGLGGRLDSTNIIVPELSVVTSIGLDHCDLLGDTLDKIACEKAGIFKPGVPAVVGETLSETGPVFRKRFEDVNSFSSDDCGERTQTLSNDSCVKLHFADREEPSLWDAHDDILSEMDLQGEYQVRNLRTSLVCLDVLHGKWQNDGDERFRRTAGDLENASEVIDSLANTARRMDFHGRWERLSVNPDVICDIGHNAAALKYNFAQLEDYLDNGRYSSLIIVYGVMADKDFDSIIPLFPHRATWIFTTPKTRRAMPAHDIFTRYTSHCDAVGLEWHSGEDAAKCNSGNSLYVIDDVAEAVKTALSLAGQTDGNVLIYIGGSTFVVSEASRLFD